MNWIKKLFNPAFWEGVAKICSGIAMTIKGLLLVGKGFAACAAA